MVDEAGRRQVVLTVSENGGGVGILGKKDKVLVAIKATTAEGTVGVQSKNSKAGAGMRVEEDGRGVYVSGKDGHYRASMKSPSRGECLASSTSWLPAFTFGLIVTKTEVES